MTLHTNHHHRKLNVSHISAVPDPIWPNFKDRLLGSSWTDSKCHSDICPCNICSCDICLYQEYLSCYWSDFDQTLKVGSWELNSIRRGKQGSGSTRSRSRSVTWWIRARFLEKKILSSDWTSWPIKMADHSLESLLQINKDGIKTKYQLEWELTEKLCRK